MNDKSTSIQLYDSESLLPQQTSQNLDKTEKQEIEDEPDISYSCNQLSYGIGDAVFATFVVAPLVVGVWRSTWSIMDLHSKLFPYAQIYLLGIIIHICFALIRSHLLSRSIATSDQHNRYFHWLKERLLSRIYTYIFILSCIMHWRGGWGLFDGTVATVVPAEADPHRPVVIAALTALCYASIAGLRSARNLLASPYFLITDGKEPTYIFTTRFRKIGQVSMGWSSHLPLRGLYFRLLHKFYKKEAYK